MSLKILLDCKKANQVCNKCQYDESNAVERFILHIHIKYCGSCRKQSERNTRLSQLIKEADLHVLPEEKKQLLHKLIEQELAKSE